MKAAIFNSTDPAERSTKSVTGTIATVLANVPQGGTYRVFPADIYVLEKLPPLGQLPQPVEITK